MDPDRPPRRDRKPLGGEWDSPENQDIAQKIQAVQSFEELYEVLEDIGGIQSRTSMELQTAEKIKRDVTFILSHKRTHKGKIQPNNLIFNSFTRDFGLRDKIIELVNKE